MEKLNFIVVSINNELFCKTSSETLAKMRSNKKNNNHFPDESLPMANDMEKARKEIDRLEKKLL